MSTWPATQRYGLNPAPGGLALVQDLINTRAICVHGADLLSDGAAATAWAAGVSTAWSAERGIAAPPHTLTDGDAARLRALRDSIAGLAGGLSSGELDSPSGTTSFAMTQDGEVQLVPTGHGWRWMSSAVWGEVLLSQHGDTWRRLKVCRAASCASAFYDRSKNNSGVWHDVKTCGNAANLRASRARRRLNA